MTVLHRFSITTNTTTITIRSTFSPSPHPVQAVGERACAVGARFLFLSDDRFGPSAKPSGDSTLVGFRSHQLTAHVAPRFRNTTRRPPHRGSSWPSSSLSSSESSAFQSPQRMAAAAGLGSAPAAAAAATGKAPDAAEMDSHGPRQLLVLAQQQQQQRQHPGRRVHYWHEWANQSDLSALASNPAVAREWQERLAHHHQVQQQQQQQQQRVWDEQEPPPWLHGWGHGGGSLVGKNVPMAVDRGTGAPVVTHAEIHAIARLVLRTHFPRRSGVLARAEEEVVRMVCAVAVVESSLRPMAYRYEAHLGEASTGLMQVLQSTADWLARDMGYCAYALDWSSSVMLYRPFEAVYFGIAYLHWLSTYRGIVRDEEFVAKGYNGGPGWANKPSTERYWQKYLLAKKTLSEPPRHPPPQLTQHTSHSNITELSQSTTTASEPSDMDLLARAAEGFWSWLTPSTSPSSSPPPPPPPQPPAPQQPAAVQLQQRQPVASPTPRQFVGILSKIAGTEYAPAAESSSLKQSVPSQSYQQQDLGPVSEVIRRPSGTHGSSPPRTRPVEVTNSSFPEAEVPSSPTQPQPREWPRNANEPSEGLPQLSRAGPAGGGKALFSVSGLSKANPLPQRKRDGR